MDKTQARKTSHGRDASRLTLRLWDFTGTAMLNLFMFLFLVTYLSPLLFMVIASLTPHRQFLDSNALILPSKRITFYYDGKDRIVSQVPTDQGIHRYILGAPAVFITLAGWGNKPVFDRAWTMLSILLMGLLAMLFAFNMWVA